MGREQLQGTPWHNEQRCNTSKDGSKRCLYNNGSRCTSRASIYHNKPCTGKGICEEFESPAGTVYKTTSEKQLHVVYHEKNAKNKNQRVVIESEKEKKIKQQRQGERKMDQAAVDKNKGKADKFIRLANERTNKILDDIDILENLSNKNTYVYTDEQVKKNFDSIETALSNAKESFMSKKRTGRFSL